MFAPPPLPLPHHRSVAASRADSALYALSASEALTSLLSSLPPLPVVSGDASPLSLSADRRSSVESLSLSACKVEEMSDDDVDGVAVIVRQQLKGGRQESSSSGRSRPQSAGAYSQASQSTASSSHSFISALSPTPPNLPARSGPLTLQLATALQPLPQPIHTPAPLPPPPPLPASATTLSSILDPHLVHLLYLYSSRSLSPFNEHSIWSCFLSHLQQPDPSQPTRRLPLCDKQYQRSSRRSFKNHVWKCLCRHFPAIAKLSYSEFRRLCATDRTVMAGFHAVTLFPRPQKKRRSTAELSDGERWLCPHGCGQEYRNTSSTSIGRHLRKECRLKDMSEERKQEERRTLKQHEKDVAAYQALRALSGVADVRLEPVGTIDLLPTVQHNKRVRLSSTEPIATNIITPLLSTATTTVSASATTTAATTLPPVPTFSPSSTVLLTDSHQLPPIATLTLPMTIAQTAATSEMVQQQQQQSVAVGATDAVSGRSVRVMSTSEIALLEAQLMDTMHTQLIIDRLLADMAARAAVAAANNNSGLGGGPIPATNSAGVAVVADGNSDWRRRNTSVVNSGELSVSSSQPPLTAAGNFSPPHFVSMSNAPSPFAPNHRQLQRSNDNSTSSRLAAIQAAASMSPPPLSDQSPLPVNRTISLVRTPSSSTSSAFSSAPPPPPAFSSAPPPYSLLTSDEAVAVIRQQLSMRCVSFLSQPGRDVRQLPSVLLQVVAGLPVAMSSSLVHDTLRALSFPPSQHDVNGRAAGNLAALQRHSEHSTGSGSGSGSGNTTGAGSNSSTPTQSPFGNDYQPSPSAQSASSGSSASYKEYSASSSSSTSLPLYPSAASILLSPLSLFDPHRLLTTPPLEAVAASSSSSFPSSYSPPVYYPPTVSLALSPQLSALLPLPSMSSSPPPQLRGVPANLTQLHEWLNALPSSTASMDRQRLVPPAATLPMAMDTGSPRSDDSAGAAAPLLRPHSHSHSHSLSHSQSQAAAVAHATAAAAGQQKLLQLATSRGSSAAQLTRSSRANQTNNL